MVCRLPPRLVAAWLTLGVVGTAASVRTTEDSRYRLAVTGPEDDSRTLCQLAARCAAAVDEAVGPAAAAGPPPTRLEITVQEPGRDSPPPPAGVLALSPAASLIEVTHEISARLLARTAAGCRSADDPPATARDWLAAALAFRVLSGRPVPLPGGRIPDYQPARNAFQAGRFPAVTSLLNSPVSPAAGPCYVLYALHCDLLASAIADGDRSAPSRLRRILELQTRGRDPETATSLIVDECRQPGEALQDWYEREVARIGRRGRRPGSVDDIASRLRELETVPTVRPGRNGQYGCDRIPLEEALGTAAAHGLDREAVSRLTGDLHELQRDAPALLRPAILDYVRALDDLQRGKTFLFGWKLRRARHAFEQAAARQRQIEQYLDTLALGTVPWQERFAAYLDVLHAEAARRQQVDPDLQRYLDSLSGRASATDVPADPAATPGPDGHQPAAPP